MNIPELPSPESIRSGAYRIEQAAGDWRIASDQLQLGKTTVSTHVSGTLSESAQHAIAAILDRGASAEDAFLNVAHELRQLAAYLDSVVPRYRHLVELLHAEELERRREFGQMVVPTLKSFDDPSYQLQSLMTEVSKKMVSVSQAIDAQARRAKESAKLIHDQEVSELTTFAVVTAIGVVVSLLAPPVASMYSAGAVTLGRTAGIARAAGVRGAVAGDSVAGAVVNAAAIRGAATIVGDSGLPISASITRGTYTYVTDGLGRVVSVSGRLEAGVGQALNPRVASSVRALGTPNSDHAGHIIARVFRGPNDHINLIPQNSNLNQGAWRSMEKRWQDSLQRGIEVKVDIKIQYPAGSSRPYRFDVASSSERQPFTFYNTPGG